MSTPNTQVVPKSGLKGLVENWRNDLIAAFSVAMVALPLGLGIAAASEVPLAAGIFSAIIGGIVTTLFRSSHIAINGPAAGLITVVLAASIGLNDGTGQTFNYVLAAIVVAGGLQIIMGFLQMGKLGEIFPSSVIHGVLAAIGIIIFGKQIHVALGATLDSKSSIGALLEIPESIMELNPYVTIISVLSLSLLILYPKIKLRFVQFIPAPMWVLIVSIPLVLLFNFLNPHTETFLGRSFHVGPEFLIDIPGNIFANIPHPNFSRIGDLSFWIAVISITLIASIETLASTKAVDKLDPYNRNTNLNKDLIGVGASTMIAGMVGGLPIITVIVRSSVNVQNNAKTKWSNFYHGVIMLVLVLVATPLIQEIPLSALAAILVYTGYKLASPQVFKHAAKAGWEQVFFMSVTLVATLLTDLLIGIFIGILTVLFVQLVKSQLTPGTFFAYLFKQKSTIYAKEDGDPVVRMKGVVNFLSILKLKKLLQDIPKGSKTKIDFGHARLVDLTALEFVYDFARRHKNTGGELEITGLQGHLQSSPHPHSIRVRLPSILPRKTARGIELERFSITNDWEFDPTIDWEAPSLYKFHFFDTRPIEYRANTIRGKYPALGLEWEVTDVTFDEGAMIAKEVFQTTAEVIHLPFKIPPFILEKEQVLDRYFDRFMRFAGYEDVDFTLFPDFSRKFLLEGKDEGELRAFFTQDLIDFFESEKIYHIESNGDSLLIFRRLRLARNIEIQEMLYFCKRLVQALPKGEEVKPV